MYFPRCDLPHVEHSASADRALPLAGSAAADATHVQGVGHTHARCDFRLGFFYHLFCGCFVTDFFGRVFTHRGTSSLSATTSSRSAGCC